jgi:signal transduction histidine kinase
VQLAIPALAEMGRPPEVGVRIAERLLVAGLQAQERADESEAARRRLEFLFKASQQLAASLEPASTIQALVELIVPEFGDGCMVRVLEPTRRTRQTTIASSEALRPSILEWWDWLERVTRPGMNRATRHATSEVASTVRKRRRTPVPASGDFSYLIVPLRARGRTLGALCVFSPESRQRYGREDLELGEALGAQAGLAIENAQLYDEQRIIVERLELVRGQLDAAQSEWLRDDERRRIARDLHDQVEQTFFAIGLTATAALNNRQGDGLSDDVARTLTHVGDLATGGAEQLRSAIFALSHTDLAGRGLVPALWKLGRTFQQRTGIETDLVLTGPKRQVPPEIAEALHAMAREALANVERHAGAGAVVLGLHITRRAVTLTVHDDGSGASSLVLREIADSTTHFGLRSIRERVKRLHGTFVAGPGPDGGFLVRARFPFSDGPNA